MNKIYSITFLFILFAFYSNSQSTYYKMLQEDTTTWQHYGFVPGVSPNSLSSFQGPQVGVSSYASLDTISFNGLKYVKFYLLNYYSNSIYYNSKSLTGYLREDTLARKIYYKANATTGDMLLYDFSQNVSDSSFWTFPNNSSLNGYYRVDSIVVKNEIAGPRKRFYYRKHVNNPNPSFYYFENIEGIGNTYHIAYLFTSNMYNLWASSSPSFQPPVTCFYNWDVGLTCKHNDQVKQFQSCTSTYSVWGWHSDQCTYLIYGGGLKSNDWERLVKVGPNPANDEIEISIEQSFETINCSVTDMAGKIIMTLPKELMTLGKNSFSFSTKDLAPGIYILQVKLNETLIKRPIVIQH